MAIRNTRWVRVLAPVLAAVVFAGLAFAIGGKAGNGALSTGIDASRQTSDASAPNSSSSRYDMASGATLAGAPAAKDVSPEELAASSGASQVGSPDQGGDPSAQIISAPSSIQVRNASIESRVDDVNAAVRRIRLLAAAQGGEITDLNIFSGDQGPQPLAKDVGPSPTNASITVRVPADKLDTLIADVAKVGHLLNQSASSNDVTQQYVDMSARLKNLKAEEARLRSLFNKANRVSDMLAVESELSRVRGEIESLQGQFDFLKRQVQMSTLSISLTEPGAVVRPVSNDWGFIEAITRGVQVAVQVLTTTITGVIALLPVVVLAAIAWLIIIGIRRVYVRNKAKRASHTFNDDEELTD